MSSGVTIDGIFDSLAAAAVSAPAFTVLVMAFLIVASLESWRPFATQRHDPDGRLPTNFGLGLINAATQFVVPFSVLMAAGWAADNRIGLFNVTDLPVAAIAVATLLIYSLASYWTHRLSHALPLLWRLHHVHHADTHIDLSTGLRNHPAELLFVVLASSAVAVAGGLSPAALLGYQIVAAGFSLWTHADFDLPEAIDWPLRLVFVTPAMHRVHHSAVNAETDSNYGEVFSIWDRLFGSYRHMSREELAAMRIGLGDGHDTGASSLLSQLTAPVKL